MKEEASSHPWHWLVPGLQHTETCHASSSDTVNLQAQKSPPSTVETCASQFFISAFTQGFGCLSGAENRYFGKGVLGEAAAGPRQRDLLLKDTGGGLPGGSHAVGQGMQGVWWAAPSNSPTAAETSVKAQAWNGSGTVTKPLSFSPPACGKDSSSMHWQPEKERLRTAPCAMNLFCFIRLSRYQQLWKCYSKTTW